MQANGGSEAPPSPTPGDLSNSAIKMPSLNGPLGHIRQKPSRVGLGDRQYSYDITTGPSARVVPRSNPSPSLLHARQHSEGAGIMEKSTPTISGTGRNASVSSFDQSTITSTSGLEGSGPPRRRHGHGHSHAHSHHHHPSPADPVPPKPASMMSIRLQFRLAVDW